MSEKIYKTTMEIYTDYDPASVEIDDLAREAVSGDAICENRKCVKIDANKVSSGVREFLGVGKRS